MASGDAGTVRVIVGDSGGENRFVSGGQHRLDAM
jgi:hypothetical protein